MFDKIADLVNADARLVRRGRFVDTNFMMVAIDDTETLLRVQEGRVTRVMPGPFITPDYSFRLAASRSVWEKFWRPLPPLVEGNLHPFMTNLLYFKDVIAAPRREAKQ